MLENIRHRLIIHIPGDGGGLILLEFGKPHGITDIQHLQRGPLIQRNGTSVPVCGPLQMIVIIKPCKKLFCRDIGRIFPGLVIQLADILQAVIVAQKTLSGIRGLTGINHIAQVIQSQLQTAGGLRIMPLQNPDEPEQHAVDLRISPVGAHVLDGYVVGQPVAGQDVAVAVVNIAPGARGTDHLFRHRHIIFLVLLSFQNLEAEQTHDQDGKHTKKNHREKKQPRCDQSLRQIRDIFPEIFKHGQCAPF